MTTASSAPTSPLYAHLRLPGDRLAVRKLAGRTVSTGGIHLPEVVDDQFHFGIVERVSPGAELAGIHAGDLVLYGKFAGTHVRIGSLERIVMSAEEVQGIVAAEHVELRVGEDGLERLAEDSVEAIAPPSIIVPGHFGGM